MAGGEFKKSLHYLLAGEPALADLVVTSRALLRGIMEGRELPLDQMQRTLAASKQFDFLPSPLEDCRKILKEAVARQTLQEAFSRAQKMGSLDELRRYQSTLIFQGEIRGEILRGLLANPVIDLKEVLSLLRISDADRISQLREPLAKLLNNQILTKGEMASLSTAPAGLLTPFSDKFQTKLEQVKAKSRYPADL